MKLSGVGLLTSSTATSSRQSVQMPASVTVIPRLTEDRMGRKVSSSSLFLNLSTPFSGGTISESMEESREGLSKSKRSYSGTSSVICTIILVA